MASPATRRPGLRLLPTAARPFVSSLLAIFAAFVAGGIFLLLRGKDPFAAYALLVQRGLGTSYGIVETLVQMAPLLIVSAGLLIALRAGMWNIGVDGQLLVGAMFAGVIGSALAGKLPNPAMWLVAAVAGMVGGLLWAVIPAILKVRWGLNEIISTLMMNYVALNVTSWLVKGPVKDPDVVPPQTRLIPPEMRLPDIPGTEVHIGLVVGILAALAVAALFRYTVFGYEFDVLGRNRFAAIHAGLPVGKLGAAALLASGAFAGLAGANDILGVKGLFQGNWNPGYGFAAFALVYLARLSSLWIIPFAWFLSFLVIGGQMMARPLEIPTSFTEILEGLMLIFFAVAVFFERRFAPHDRDVAAEAQLFSPVDVEPIVSPEAIPSGGKAR